MKKKIFSLILCGIIVLGVSGCSGNIKNVSISELNELQEQITIKISEQNDYNNFASCSIDEENKVVIVELVDNSEEQQEWFKKNISNSDYIKFEQGGPYTTSNVNCLENVLGGYITSEKITPKEISLNEIVNVDIEKLEYSKVKITDNDLIYAIIKTSDEKTIEVVGDYFNKKYNNYQSSKTNDGYYIYLYNGYNDFNLDDDLEICK